MFEDSWLLTDAAWAWCAGNAAQLATKVKAGEEGRVAEVSLRRKDMEELPASVGRLQKLQKLDLGSCTGLSSLPAELGGLQALEVLDLTNCKGLTSLPDLSGLEKLKVESLPERLNLWEEGGRKAFALDKLIAQSEDGWLLGDEEWARCAGNAAQLLSKLTPNKEGRIVEVDLRSGMMELPASVGKLQKLQRLNLDGCRSLTSLPSELGGLQKLEKLDLTNCESLASLPDLSGLDKLEVKHLPEKLKPWEEGGRKAFALG